VPHGGDETALQVALALRDEVDDLEAAGTALIQVDEPALRETLPLRAADREQYLAWATEAFRLTTSGVRADTQIHTHMCYAEFGEILTTIDNLDADVISLEAARSHMQVAHELAHAGYPREVGPGVYDIHSPRVPDTAEVVALLREGLKAVPAERLWVTNGSGSTPTAASRPAAGPRCAPHWSTWSPRPTRFAAACRARRPDSGS
jgi:5-methyltetrahydropteroyltriglutamate--homocysteine methyltransferase